jgi:hypothetical protein
LSKGISLDLPESAVQLFAALAEFIRELIAQTTRGARPPP